MNKMSVLSRDYGLRIVSGGQTGADLAGIRAAQSVGLMTGGWAPARFKTLLGPKPQLSEFGLVALTASGYAARTRQNVIDSDVTVVIAQHMESSGTKLTINLCMQTNRPFYKLQVEMRPDGFGTDLEIMATAAKNIANLMKAKLLARPNEPFLLNIAGNSSQSAPRIFIAAFVYTLQLLTMFEKEVSTSNELSDAFCIKANQMQQMHIAMQLEDNFDYIPQLDPRRAVLVLELEA
jgi:hypothetical protein